MTEKKSTAASGRDDAPPSIASESSAGYLSAESAPLPRPDAQGSAGVGEARRASKGSGVIALVGLALVVGISLALFLVRESPWLAQKILKEQQTQALLAAGGANPDLVSEPSPQSHETQPSGAPSSVPGVPVSPSLALVPGIDPLLVQRLSQIQQWAAVLRATPSGPRDPSRDLVSVLSAGRETNKAADPVGPEALPTPEGGSLASGPEGALPGNAASTSGPLMQWLGQAVSVTGSFLSSLVRIQQVSEPSLSGQTQAFFAQVDQQAQSHLMAARLMLLHGQSTLAIAEFDALLALLQRHYEASEARINVLRGEVTALRDALKDPV
jgi:hypothetical protein